MSALVGIAAVIASGLMFGAGPATADPEPPNPPPATSDPFLEEESRLVAEQERAETSGAIGVGIDPSTGSVVAVYPSDVELPNHSGKIKERHAAIDKETMKRFDQALNDRSWDPRAREYIYAYSVDVASGRIVMGTNAPAAVTAQLSAAFPSLDVSEVDEIGRMSRQDDSPPHWGGAALTSNGSNRCTSGFTVKHANGTRFMVTAGHCFPLNTAVRSPGGSSFGRVINRATYPAFDMELLYGASYGSYIYTGNLTGTGTPVGGATDPAVGGFYCVSGQTTATTCDHKVDSLGGTLCDPAGDCTRGLIRASGGGRVAHGDSGAPFFGMHAGYAHIRGILIGVGGEWMYAEKYKAIATYFGVSIVTSG